MKLFIFLFKQLKEIFFDVVVYDVEMKKESRIHRIDGVYFKKDLLEQKENRYNFNLLTIN